MWDVTWGRSMPSEITQWYVCELLELLKNLNTNGVIHHDIKPENILLNERFESYISDLGIAQGVTANCAEFDQGTKGFMAPEVFFPLK